MRIYEDLRGLHDRLRWLRSAVVAGGVLVACAFWYIQVARGKYFRELAENNRIHPVTLAAPRGALLDRNGRVLVENRPAFNLVLTPDVAENLDRTVARLARLVRMPVASVRERLGRRGPLLRSIVVKQDAPIDDVASVQARRLEQPEVGVDVVPVRHYPLGSAAAHALGRVGEISERQLNAGSFEGVSPGSLVGQAGIEFQYNRYLMGTDGVRRVVVNSRGAEVQEAARVEPVAGPPVTLTLDLELQRAVEEAMAGKSGSVVALDPKTGEILAMTSAPAYDPNQFAVGIDHAEWARLTTDPETPLMNRVIQGQYAAGSTFKVPMAVAALVEGLITPTTTFYCPGSLAIYGTSFRCHKEEGHGTVDLRRALALSCNVFFYHVGVRLEIERIARYARRFGLSAVTGVDLPHEASGLIPDPAWKQRVLKAPWYAGETVSVSIGQGQVSVTPIQQARLAAAVATGLLVQPHLVRAVGPRTLPYPDPRPLGIKAEALALVRDAMRAVVDEGTGRRAQVRGVAVAGKTGSAQVVTHGRLERDKHARELQPHGWFICFAPAEDPRIAMAVLVEHGKSGGESAAPVAGYVLSRFFGVTPMITPSPVPEPPTATVAHRLPD